MAHRQAFLLQVWRSKTLAGWQWAARVQQLADGQEQRFTDPELLMAYLRSAACAVEHEISTLPLGTASGPACEESQVDGEPP